ncbi:MAG: GEVED domain-containing protein [Bacteroidota bacterium]
MVSIKILLGHLKKIPLLLSLLLLCAGSIVGQSFECNSDLYQVVNGNELKRLNPSTGIYESVGTSSITYNGAGFNSEDNFIYAIGSGTTLVRIDNTGDATSLGNISNFSAISYSGDFDLEGNWYSFRKSGSSWLLNKIDVSVLPAVAERLTVQELSGPAPASNANDIAYNIVSNRFYGMDDGYIMEFDPVARTVRTLADYREITEDGGYGAVWSDETGNTYFFNNNTGNIYRAAINASGEITSFAFISTSSPNGNNDGMSCPTALPPAFPEICDNGIDDDNDGLVDCEDPDCSASASCGISSEIYSSSFACNQSIVTYHTFFTNHSNLTNTITVTEQLPQGFVFLQDTLEFDAGGNSDFTSQPQEGDEGTITWGNIHLNAGETVRISYDVTLKSEVQFGTVANSISVTPDRDEILITPTVLSSEITVGDCPEPASYSCEPAFYQVYKKKGKNQPNMYGRLNPITGDYDPIAVASDYANGLGYDVNSGIVFGASGNRFISLDKDGIVIDQGITFSKKVYRGDINNSSEWYGVVGNDMLKIDVSGPPTVMATYANQGLQGWDIAYNTDGNFYSLHNSTLYQFNTSTNTKITIGQLAGVNLPQSGGYGAQWTGSDGYLYASHNQSGRILRINVEDATARVVSQSIDGLSKNDGFSCPTSIPVVFEYDYGDNSRLPQSRILSYRQDLGQDGLPDFSTFWLGNTVNYDLDDPSNASSDGDLDDGVTFTNQIDNGTISAIIGLNTNISGTAYYLIGLDWNDDGIFDEILNNHQVMEGANTIVEIINAPTSYTGGFLNARVIVSEELLTQDQISGDILGLGEIEDYRLEIFEPCYGEECEVTTGTNGGLESNGDLSEAIAKRNYGRLKNNYKKHIKSHQKELKEFKISRSGRANGISNYFPEFGVSGKEEVTVSSPEDLIGITNAKEVFAVDYYLNNQRVAASLLLSTENEVYNHSKNVCDRLNGKSINDVRIIHVSGMSIILANIKHETGNMEYSAWFSAREANDQYEVFSQWNVDSYPEGKYLNFQVWSSSPAQVFYLLEHIIAELKKSRKVITNSKHQQLPDLDILNSFSSF